MSDISDEQQIRAVLAQWMAATADGDIARVLQLMSEDVIYLRPNHEPMQGRDAFAAGFREALGHVSMEGQSEIQEIRIFGDLAYCWNQLTVTATPCQGGAAVRRAGPVMSIFRRESDGQWRLWRDANML